VENNVVETKKFLLPAYGAYIQIANQFYMIFLWFNYDLERNIIQKVDNLIRAMYLSPVCLSVCPSGLCISTTHPLSMVDWPPQPEIVSVEKSEEAEE
jgi:hypothetical protein